MCPRKRRDLLALAGATATTLAAGCLSTSGDPATGTSTDDRTTEEPSGHTTTPGGGATATVDGEFAATTWLPAPDALEADRLFVFAGDLAAPRDAGVADGALTRVYDVMLALPRDAALRDAVTEFATVQGYATACRYDAETSDVRDLLDSLAGDDEPTATAGEGTRADATGDADSTGDDDSASDDAPTSDAGTTTPTGRAPDGYEGYATDFGTYWLGADHLVFGRRRRFAAAMLNARAGDVERYASHPDLASVLDAAGDVDLLAGTAASHQVVDSVVAYAYGWRFGERVDLVAPFAFDDAAATDADAVAALGEQAGFASYEGVDVTTDGRVVAFTGDVSVDEFDLLQRDDDDGGRTATAGSDSVPQVSFAFEAVQGKDGEWDGDAEERVVVTHQGGDTVDLANVALHYEGSDVAKSDGISSTKPAGDTWAAGGEWTLRVDSDGDGAAFESDATLRVVWTADDGSRSAVIAMYQLP